MQDAKTAPARPLQSARVYSTGARHFHWWTVALVVVMVPLGLAMSYRGNTLNIWDATTDRMYSLHKLIGFTLLLLVIARLVYRLRNGVPADEPTLPPSLRVAAHTNHWLLYLLLLIVPLLGWSGVQLFGATGVFGLFNLPTFLSKDQALAAQVFTWHFYAALTLVALIALHIAAALYHYFIRKDGVLSRMLPGRGE